MKHSEQKQEIQLNYSTWPFTSLPLQLAISPILWLLLSPLQHFPPPNMMRIIVVTAIDAAMYNHPLFVPC